MTNEAEVFSTHNVLPCAAGISLKPQHFTDILTQKPAIAWFEIHPENYMGDGGLPHHYLEKIRTDYPISMHSVGMSLGSADGLDKQYLQHLKNLSERYAPAKISDHLSWSRTDGKFLNDLLPLPYTEEALDIICQNVDVVQQTLQRQILIENPSVYVAFESKAFDEGAFIQEIVRRTQCGLLLDVNNIYVSASNNGQTPEALLATYDVNATQEIHVAGHTLVTLDDDSSLRIDDHGSPVCDDVWALFELCLHRINKPVATLIEWDTNVPALDVLLREANKIDQRLTALASTCEY